LKCLCLEYVVINFLSSTNLPENVFEQACTWFIKLQGENVTPQMHQDFSQWLASDSLNPKAWQEVQLLFASLEIPAKKIRANDGVTPVINIPKQSNRVKFISYAIAASVLIFVSLTFNFQTTLIQNFESDYYTTTGSQKLINLADGSRLLLNTDSAVTIDIASNVRQVSLLRGEVFFEVAHAPQRPFWVIAGEARARVTGTEFSVGRTKDNVTITVAKGRVETSVNNHDDEITPLVPGESAHYQGTNLISFQAVDVDKTLAWRNGQMVFVQQSLNEVVEQINRYRPGLLIIRDEQLKKRAVTAVFSVEQLDEAIKALEQTLGIHAIRLTNYLILLG